MACEVGGAMHLPNLRPLPGLSPQEPNRRIVMPLLLPLPDTDWQAARIK
jgi:hypothetical protein